MIHEQGGDTTSGEQPEAGALFNTGTNEAPPIAATLTGARLLKLHAPTDTDVVVDELDVVVVDAGTDVDVVGTVVVATIEVVAGLPGGAAGGLTCAVSGDAPPQDSIWAPGVQFSA